MRFAKRLYWVTWYQWQREVLGLTGTKYERGGTVVSANGRSGVCRVRQQSSRAEVWKRGDHQSPYLVVSENLGEQGMVRRRPRSLIISLTKTGNLCQS